MTPAAFTARHVISRCQGRISIGKRRKVVRAPSMYSPEAQSQCKLYYRVAYLPPVRKPFLWGNSKRRLYCNLSFG